MMRSLFSAVSGLKNHQTQMDVIGNNIANVNTMGYKASRVVFQDMYSQLSKAASAPGQTVGGTNPLQIGLGMRVAAINIMQTSAATQVTDNPLDLSLEGDGYFVVKMPDDTFQYTRAGNFLLDENGNLVTAAGNFVQGVPAPGAVKANFSLTDQDYVTAADGTVYAERAGYSLDPTGVLLDQQGIPVVATAGQTFAAWTTGNLQLVDNVYYAEQGGANVDAEGYLLDGPGGARVQALNAIASSDGMMDKGALKQINLSQYTGISIDESGLISGLDVNLEKVSICYVAVATFTNPQGLETKGNNMYAETVNTGTTLYSVAQTNGSGKVNPGALEMSNVDLANEFTNMIMTQRGFQASSRIITTSDTLLEELVNLKR
jgi:flagellar hook protein FlgE